MNTICKVSSLQDVATLPKFAIESYVWGKEYTPVSYAQLGYVEGEGFAVRLVSFEKEPLARYRVHDEPVYTDSCLEFFANFAPKASPKYVNFETNSLGTLLSGFGAYREARLSTIDLSSNLPKVEPIKGSEGGETFWGVQYLVPFALIRDLYQIRPVSGDVIRVNFYKCGDDTAIPHFGSCFPINLPSPDFHCPQFFGELVLE